VLTVANRNSLQEYLMIVRELHILATIGPHHCSCAGGFFGEAAVAAVSVWPQSESQSSPCHRAVTISSLRLLSRRAVKILYALWCSVSYVDFLHLHSSTPPTRQWVFS